LKEEEVKKKKKVKEKEDKEFRTYNCFKRYKYEYI